MPQGAHGPVVRVEVSIDEGETWADAELLKAPVAGAGKWSWALWRAVLPVQRGWVVSIFSRATDAGGNRQPAPEEAVWNLRGVGYNAYGRAVGVKIR